MCARCALSRPPSGGTHREFETERSPQPGNRRRRWTGHDCGQTSSSSAKRSSGGPVAPAREANRRAPYVEKHRYTQFHRQLRCHTCLSPSRILLCHLHDEFADVLRNSWPTSLRLPFPKQRETLAMPADQRLGFDEAGEVRTGDTCGILLDVPV